MADNTTINTMSGGDVIATHDFGAYKGVRGITGYLAANGLSIVDVTPTSGLPVTITGSLPAGTNTIGAVSQGTSPWVMGLNSVSGTAVDVNSGNKSAGTIRVVLATDQPALTNKILVTPDANAAVNVSQMNGVAVAMGNGVSGTGVQRVVIATDNTGVVGEVPLTTGGCASSSFLSTGAVQATQVKGSAGQVYSIQFTNVSAAAVYVRLYNQTGAPATTDAANIVWRGIIPGNSAGAGVSITFPGGLTCSTGIGMRCSAAIADNDATVLSANTVMGNVVYK